MNPLMLDTFVKTVVVFNPIPEVVDSPASVFISNHKKNKTQLNHEITKYAYTLIRDDMTIRLTKFDNFVVDNWFEKNNSNGFVISFADMNKPDRFSVQLSDGSKKKF